MARGDAGSVFVEAVIAAAITAMALGGTFQVIGDSAGRARAAESRREALMVARSELAAVGVALPLAAGQTAGLAGDMAWRVEISPYADGVAASDAGALWRVAVTVRSARGGPVLARLETLSLGPSA